METSETIVVNGGHHLEGDVQIAGAKNSVLKLMAASVMASGQTCIHNVPDISDVSVMQEVLKALGAQVSTEDDQDGGGHTLYIDTADLTTYVTPYDLVAQMRASISILGPLIARFGRARVAMPGGCRIGARSLDLHISSLESLGVTFDMDHGYIQAEAPDGLSSCEVLLDYPSVGATENLMMAATVADGDTHISNAAREPEIADLADFLNGMGADVEGAGSPNIVIHGVKELHPTEHTTVGDRIEAGTFLVAGALCGGPVHARGIDPDFLALPLKKLAQMGCDIETNDDVITVSRNGDIEPVDLQTLPHPGFPTDLQAQFMVLSSLAQGNSIVTENVFENRFMFASELGRMGADIRIDAHHALISGVDHLEGAPVEASDLRGGAALVLAGLAAEGESRVSHVEYIDRGYEDFVGKLRGLGAGVTRVPAPAD
ncbi:MAG: UDP-N-acetylglucosamine 1-carboxyvinyltransferase [Coriobacteriaceae bacterium]|nr:UDP-N-acetylglucosamine 1-carboxyvinyltransferase [Coriobacteriaceae bacterium]